MLVLTGKTGETIHLGDTIRVVVLHSSPGSVRLGFEAPGHVKILRNKLYESHRREQGPVETGKVVQP